MIDDKYDPASIERDVDDGVKAMLGREISRNIVWPTCKDHEEDAERVFIYLSDHDRIVAELRDGNNIFSEQIAKNRYVIAELRAELETARSVREKLKDSLFWFEVNSYDKRDAEKAGQFWRELVAIEKDGTK